MNGEEYESMRVANKLGRLVSGYFNYLLLPPGVLHRHRGLGANRPRAPAVYLVRGVEHVLPEVEPGHGAPSPVLGLEALRRRHRRSTRQPVRPGVVRHQSREAADLARRHGALAVVGHAFDDRGDVGVLLLVGVRFRARPLIGGEPERHPVERARGCRLAGLPRGASAP